MDMSTQEQWALRSDDRIWRAWPDTETTGAYVLTVAAATTGWPTQQTSCACLWCNRFAMSYGVYGWSGPEFTSWLLSADGRQEDTSLPDFGHPWHGPTADGCTLQADEASSGLSAGPWQWQCGAQ